MFLWILRAQVIFEAQWKNAQIVLVAESVQFEYLLARVSDQDHLTLIRSNDQIEFFELFFFGLKSRSCFNFDQQLMTHKINFSIR